MAHPVDPLTELPHDDRVRSRKLVIVSDALCDDEFSSSKSVINLKV